MDIKTLQINLKNLMNKWFYTREQIHKLLEEYVIVDSGGILRVGLPSAKEITLTTTNNAITTADVAEVKATVTGNTDQELVYGVPVQFVNRATREVLYNGTTDENGECLFQYFTEEAEILPIQARISNDFIFRDDGRLNSYNSWDYNNNVTIQHISTHSIVSRADTSSSVGTLGTLLLSGYCDIDFKVKIPSDGSADFLFCRIVEQTSTGQIVDNGSSNTFKLSDLNLTTEKWYNFHISVLDDRIVLYCKDTGETKRIWLDEAYPYYRFQLLPSLSVPTICFSDVKITRCSDDLSMFIKENRNLCGFNLWSGTDYIGAVSNETTSKSNFRCTKGMGVLESSKEWSSNFEKSIKQTLLATDYTVFFYYDPDMTLTYTASITVYSEVNGVVYFIARDEPNSNNTIIKSINFKPSNQPQKITLTINQNEFTGTETQLQLRLVNLEEGTIYSDDWNLTYH